MHSIISSTALVFGVLATSVLASPQYGDDSSSTMSMTASAPASTASNIHNVKVGPGLTFSPDSVTAAEGDWVEFTFGSGHSVAQSSFDAPCVPLGDAALYSGFPNDGDIWRVQVNSTDPMWLYCSASGHCEGGMALVVNPPSSGNTLDAYKSAAANAQGSSPETVQGGVFGAATADTSSGSSSSSASSSGSSSASATGSAASASSTGNAATSNALSNGLMVLGAVAAGIAAAL